MNNDESNKWIQHAQSSLEKNAFFFIIMSLFYEEVKAYGANGMIKLLWFAIVFLEVMSSRLSAFNVHSMQELMNLCIRYNLMSI